MKLKDHMDEAVADVTADLPSLAAAARSQGLGQRRRRHALAAVGAAAAVTAIVGGSLALQHSGGPGSDPATVASEPAPSVGELSGETVPITGRAAAAALMAAVDEVADGAFTRVGGSDPLDLDRTTLADDETSASFLFSPDGTTTGEVFANIQSYTATFEETDQPKCDDSDPDCRGSIDQGMGPYDECASYMDQCRVTELAGRDVLRTYLDPISTEGVVRTVAELISPERDLRLVLGADNGVLTTGQLGDVVTQPWWDFDRLPVEYAEAGDDLEGYHDSQGVTREGMPSPAGP